MRKMAQRQVQLSSLPQTREAQQQQETRESAQLFFNSLGHLAQGDADLSQEESTTLQRSTHEAEQEVGTGTDQDSVYVNIADDLKCIADQVDAVVAHYDGYFEEILMKEDPDAMTQAFLKVGGEVFRGGITIRRIFVLLLFGYKLVKYFLRKMAQGVAQLIPADVTKFIILAGKFICEVFVKYKVLSWVREQGGWQNLAPAVSWTSVAIFAGVVLAGVGFVARIWK